MMVHTCRLDNAVSFQSITYFIVAIVGHHPEYFEILHGFILKYAFYIFIWSLWLLWEELFVKYK